MARNLNEDDYINVVLVLALTALFATYTIGALR